MRNMWDLLKSAGIDYAGRSKTQYTGEDCLYDTNSIAPGTLFPGSYSFFAQGVNGGSKTYAQTNLDSNGQLSNNDAFLIMGFRFAFFSSAAQADLNFLANNTFLSVKFYNNEFFKGIPEMFPGGSSIYTTAASSLALVTATYPGPLTSNLNGLPSKHNYFSLGDDGILLRDNDQLKVTLVNAAGPYTTLAAAAGGFGLTMRCWFDGYRIRQTS